MAKLPRSNPSGTWEVTDATADGGLALAGSREEEEDGDAGG